ncbi:hypothetical protein [Halegenticoccus soli]|uniref:hypothetical protein n=1 Tax=Halegenticoccus soli TaxID=1985678 RepID=UPI000C6CB39F|nr:hypothetical protein [Halegenticoccus soli]
MPNEDNRFGDIAEQLQQTEDREQAKDGEDITIAEDTQAATTTESVETINEEGAPPATQEMGDSDEEEPASGPAFSFDKTNMHGFYVREGTWKRVTRMRSSVTAACSMFDVSEFEGREFQDACLQVVADHGDEVALQILRERGVEADEERVQEIVEMLNSQVIDD